MTESALLLKNSNLVPSDYYLLLKIFAQNDNLEILWQRTRDTWLNNIGRELIEIRKRVYVLEENGVQGHLKRVGL